jgi:hypothetical protein
MDDDSFAKELQLQLAYWQKVLYLQDWTVDLRISRQWEMLDAGTLAECHWFLERKDAIIRVLAPADLGGLADKFLNDEECDYDISLVHELLHLHFAAFYTEKDEIAHEQVINAISRGLVKIWRENEQNSPVIANIVVKPPSEVGGHYL